MRRAKSVLAGLLAVGFLTTSAQASWLHFANSVFRAEVTLQKHPARLEQTIVMPRDASDPLICAAYDNNFKKKNSGKVTTRVHHSRDLQTVGRFELQGNVRRNSSVECRPIGNLESGDVLVFEYQFERLPKLRTQRKRTDYFSVHTLVSTAGAVCSTGVPPVVDSPQPPTSAAASPIAKTAPHRIPRGLNRPAS